MAPSSRLNHFGEPQFIVVESYARCYDIDIDNIDITFSPIYICYLIKRGNLTFWCCKVSRLDTLIAVQSSSILLAYVIGGLQGQFKNGDKSGKGKFTWNTGGSYKVRCFWICMASGGVICGPLRCIHLCTCQGDFDANDMHGEGRYQWSDGRSYTGQWRRTETWNEGDQPVSPKTDKLHQMCNVCNKSWYEVV